MPKRPPKDNKESSVETAVEVPRQQQSSGETLQTSESSAKSFLLSKTRLWSVALFALVTVVTWNALGLGSLRDILPYADTGGFIFVDSPEVYTRERLVNERFKEDAWLNQKLEEADQPENLVGVLRKIEQVRAAGKAAVQAQVGGSSSQDQTPTDNEVLNNKLTFNEKISIQSSNRDLITQKIIENRLDDRHDLDNNSLYILKFDTAVVVNERSDKSAMVGIELVPPVKQQSSGSSRKDRVAALFADQSDAQMLRETFQSFLKTVKRQVNNAVLQVDFSEPSVPILAKQIEIAIANRFTVDLAATPIITNYMTSKVSETFEENELYELRIYLGDVSRFFDFQTLFKYSARSSGGKKDPPTFDTMARQLNFYVASPECKAAGAADVNNTTLLKSAVPVGGLDQLEEEALKPYISEESTDTKALYISTTLEDRQLIAPTEARETFLKLLSLLIIETRRVPTEKANTYSNVFDLVQFTDGPGGCREIHGNYNFGFVEFVGRVSAYTSYAYSALPKQSSSSVVEQIVETNTADLSAPDVAGSQGFGGIFASNKVNQSSSSLRSRVAAFGSAQPPLDGVSENVLVGWIINPNASSTERHGKNLRTISESVQAIVSVPAWWPHIHVRICKQWLNSSGTPLTQPVNGQLFVQGANPEKDRCFQTGPAGESAAIKVVLPNTQQDIENVAFDQDQRLPIIRKITCENTLEAGLPGKISCLIAGRRLWRNTVVTAGVVENLKIRILPNMDGLIAEFPYMSKIPDDCSIRVWTSEGVADRLENCNPESETP